MSKVRSVVLLTIAKGVNVVLNFLLLPYLARALSYEDYGTYGQTLLVIDLTKVLLVSGLGLALYYQLAIHSHPKKVISSTFFLSLFLSIVALISLQLTNTQIAHFLNNPDLAYYLSFYALTFLFSMHTGLLTSLLIYYKKAPLLSLFLVTYNLIRVALLVIAIQLFHSLFLVFVGLLIADLIYFLLLLFPLRSRITLSQVDTKLALETYKQGVFLNLTNILGYLFLYSDSVMVSHLLDVKEYAIYRNGAIEVPFFSTIYVSVAQIVLPEVTKRYQRQAYGEIISLKRKACQNTLLITYPVYFFLLFYHQDLFHIYLSEKYIQSAPIFAVFNSTLLLRIYDYLDVLIAAGKNRLILLVHLFAFCLNLFLNYWLIKWGGSIGAAIATVSSLFLYISIFSYFIARTLSTSLLTLFPWKTIATVSAICVLYLIPLTLIYSSIDLNPVWKLPIVTLLYFIPIFYIFLKYNFFDPQVKKFLFGKIPFLSAFLS